MLQVQKQFRDAGWTKEEGDNWRWTRGDQLLWIDPVPPRADATMDAWLLGYAAGRLEMDEAAALEADLKRCSGDNVVLSRQRDEAEAEVERLRKAVEECCRCDWCGAEVEHLPGCCHHYPNGMVGEHHERYTDD